ncbi:MAG TPA: PLP-dependent aminotransferase family protein [Candidatus Cybelea sp.]
MPIQNKVKEPIDLEPLFPDHESSEPLGAQFVRRLRTAIKSGFFPTASRLLPSRTLARRLGISRNTVTSALDQLVAEGYLEARVGAGTFVTDTLHEPRKLTDAPARQLPIAARELTSIQTRLDAVGSSFGPLRVGAPDLSAFPLRTWQRLERKNLAVVEEYLDYYDASGLLDLRRAISGHIAQFRGVVADSDQIIVVEGTQGALDLIAFVLTKCGSEVAIEDPCYQLARAIFEGHGLLLHGVAVDRAGMRTNELPREASLAYVTPSHQFPLGGAMPLARRKEILEWAQLADAYIVEDDYDSEFDAHPLPALQSLDRDDRVIYVGTLSKTLAPGLRAAYIVAPRHLAPTLRFARAVTSLGGSPHLQKTIADFIAGGYFSRHVRHMTAIYERRRRIVVDTFAKGLPPGFSVGPAQTGLHVAISGPLDFDDVRAANTMPPGNRVLPISLLCLERTDCKGLLVGFSAGSDEAVAHAAAMLAGSLHS